MSNSIFVNIKLFFRWERESLRIAGFKPRKINSDGSAANAKAVMMVNAELSPSEVGPAKPIQYTKVKYCNNILEQDHRRVKRITDPMLGFKSFASWRMAQEIAEFRAVA